MTQSDEDSPLRTTTRKNTGRIVSTERPEKRSRAVKDDDDSYKDAEESEAGKDDEVQIVEKSNTQVVRKKKARRADQGLSLLYILDDKDVDDEYSDEEDECVLYNLAKIHDVNNGAKRVLSIKEYLKAREKAHSENADDEDEDGIIDDVKKMQTKVHLNFARNVECFVVTEDHIKERRFRSSVTPGQVGFRCRFCKGRDPQGTVFPKSLAQVQNRISRDIFQEHWLTPVGKNTGDEETQGYKCSKVPVRIRKELIKCKKENRPRFYQFLKHASANGLKDVHDGYEMFISHEDHEVGGKVGGKSGDDSSLSSWSGLG